MSAALPIHPSTGLHAIGYLRNGAPVWPVIGASEPPAEPPAPEPPATEEPPAPEPEKPKPADTVDWKTRAREWERRSKENADKAKKFDELEAAKKSAEERLAEAKTAADQRAAAALARAVRAETKALAAAEFADPTDAEGAINPADFVSADGEIDTDGIKRALTELLERKPHWRRNGKPGVPQPDPSQGPKAPVTTATVAAGRALYEQRHPPKKT